jgi:hypothetical protein
MKNVLRFTLAALALVGLSFTESEANGTLGTVQLQWRFPATGNVNNAVDSKVLAASVSDTSSFVSTDGILIPTGNYNTAATDSAAVAIFAVSVDTSYSVPQGSFTVTLQGSYGDQDGVFTAGSFTINPTTGAKYFTVPVYLAKAVAASHPTKFQQLSPRLRIIVVNGVTAWAACRVSFQALWANQIR